MVYLYKWIGYDLFHIKSHQFFNEMVDYYNLFKSVVDL